MPVHQRLPAPLLSGDPGSGDGYAPRSSMCSVTEAPWAPDRALSLQGGDAGCSGGGNQLVLDALRAAGRLGAPLVGKTSAFTDPSTAEVNVSPALSGARGDRARAYEAVNRSHAGAFAAIHEATWSGEVRSAWDFADQMLEAEAPAMRAVGMDPGQPAEVQGVNARDHYAGLFPQVRAGAWAAVAETLPTNPTCGTTDTATGPSSGGPSSSTPIGAAPKTGLRDPVVIEDYANAVASIKAQPGYAQLSSEEQMRLLVDHLQPILKAQGLPPINVRFADISAEPGEDDTFAKYDATVTGDILLDRKNMQGQSLDQLASKLYHEAVHVETGYRSAQYYYQYGNKDDGYTSQQKMMGIPHYLLTQPTRKAGESDADFAARCQRQEAFIQQAKTQKLKKGSAQFQDAEERYKTEVEFWKSPNRTACGGEIKSLTAKKDSLKQLAPAGPDPWWLCQEQGDQTACKSIAENRAVEDQLSANKSVEYKGRPSEVYSYEAQKVLQEKLTGPNGQGPLTP